MSWQRRSRNRGSLLARFPFTGCAVFLGGLVASDGPANDPISSTEQSPMPYALRSARLTARVSAIRISAPWTRGETFDGSASPYPTNPLQVRDLNTVPLKTHRELGGSEDLR